MLPWACPLPSPWACFPAPGAGRPLRREFSVLSFPVATGQRTKKQREGGSLMEVPPTSPQRGEGPGRSPLLALSMWPRGLVCDSHHVASSPWGALGWSPASLWCVGRCVFLWMCDTLWRDAFAHKSPCCGEFSQVYKVMGLKGLVPGWDPGSPLRRSVACPGASDVFLKLFY